MIYSYNNVGYLMQWMCISINKDRIVKKKKVYYNIPIDPMTRLDVKDSEFSLFDVNSVKSTKSIINPAECPSN